MPENLDIRLLRNFVTVAEELHFGRAAQRLFIAQQALSRDMRRLEKQVGVRLLDRTTRRVTLTAAGGRLMNRARELIALHDVTLDELRDKPSSLTVDVVGAQLTPTLVLAHARRIAPDVEFFARFHTGLEPAAPLVSAGRLDVTFGRLWDPTDHLRQRAVRTEPLAVLLPENHRLADLQSVPLPALHGDDRPCFRAGDHATAGWQHAVLQLLTPAQTYPTDGHPHVQGSDELAKHIHDRDVPILTVITQPPVAGAVLRPVTEPSAYFPWRMIWRSDLAHPGLHALHQAIDELTKAGDWLAVPEGGWLPEPEVSQSSWA